MSRAPRGQSKQTRKRKENWKKKTCRAKVEITKINNKSRDRLKHGVSCGGRRTAGAWLRRCAGVFVFTPTGPYTRTRTHEHRSLETLRLQSENSRWIAGVGTKYCPPDIICPRSLLQQLQLTKTIGNRANINILQVKMQVTHVKKKKEIRANSVFISRMEFSDIPPGYQKVSPRVWFLAQYFFRMYYCHYSFCLDLIIHVPIITVNCWYEILSEEFDSGQHVFFTFNQKPKSNFWNCFSFTSGTFWAATDLFEFSLGLATCFVTKITLFPYSKSSH